EADDRHPKSSIARRLATFVAPGERFASHVGVICTRRALRERRIEMRTSRPTSAHSPVGNKLDHATDLCAYLVHVVGRSIRGRGLHTGADARPGHDWLWSFGCFAYRSRAGTDTLPR